MVKVNIVSGFLGAGKTTFIKKLLEQMPESEKIVIIENEFGDASVDSQILSEKNVIINELNSGCICCSLSSSLVLAIEEIIQTFRPTRIIIEPSGVARIPDILNALIQLKETFPIDLKAILTIIGGVRSQAFLRKFQTIYRNQIESADIIFLSRTQNMNTEEIDKQIEHIRELNLTTLISAEPWDQIIFKDFIDQDTNYTTNNFDAQSNQEKPRFKKLGQANITCKTIVTKAIYTYDDLNSILLKIKEMNNTGNIIRIKGFVRAYGGKAFKLEYTLDETTIVEFVPQHNYFINIFSTNINMDELSLIFR